MEAKNFRHHPDNIIFIFDGTNHYQCSLDEFLLHNPNYNLPEFFIGREYFQGKAHRLYTSKNEIFLDNEIWEEGDGYIDDAHNYLTPDE